MMHERRSLTGSTFLSLPVILTLFAVACGGGTGSSPGGGNPVTPTPQTPSPTECRSSYCKHTGSVAGYGTNHHLLYPSMVGQLTITLTWSDPAIDLDMNFGKVLAGGMTFPMIVENPHTGNRESYTLALASYDIGLNDICWISVTNNKAVTTAYTLEISITAASLVPQLIAPSDGATLDNGCTYGVNAMTWDFDWSDVSGATAYELYVIHPSAAGPMIDKDSLTTSSYRFSDDMSFTYRYQGWQWKVRAKVGGVFQDWSRIGTFNVEAADTDCPR